MAVPLVHHWKVSNDDIGDRIELGIALLIEPGIGIRPWTVGLWDVEPAAFSDEEVVE